MTQAKTPGRRPKPDDQRKVHVNTSMTLEQREMFLTLGGSAWLQKEMDMKIACKPMCDTSEFANFPFGWTFHPQTRVWSKDE